MHCSTGDESGRLLDVHRLAFDIEDRQRSGQCPRRLAWCADPFPIAGVAVNDPGGLLVFTASVRALGSRSVNLIP